MRGIEVIGYEEGIICNFLEMMDIDADKNVDMEMKRRRHNRS
jgi:hypothetical protein